MRRYSHYFPSGGAGKRNLSVASHSSATIWTPASARAYVSRMALRQEGGWTWRGLALFLACAPRTLLPVQALGQTQPELPRVFLDTTYSPPTRGKLIPVSAGGDPQAALQLVSFPRVRA